jgi:hypothetical protein
LRSKPTGIGEVRGLSAASLVANPSATTSRMWALAWGA